MRAESEEASVAAEVPVAKPRLTIVAALAMLVGVLIASLVVGAFVAYRQTRALRTELLGAKKDLAQKSRQLDETKGDLATLSRQLYALREHSVARSGGERPERQAEAPPATAVVAPIVPVVPAAPAAPPAAAVKATPEPVRRAASRREGQSCEIAGKPAAEQAAILQRCVGAMEGRPSAPTK